MSDSENKSKIKIPPLIQNLSQDDEAILEKNIVWIFGVRRSGTTWLRELLSHNTKFMRETHISEHLAVNSKNDNFLRKIDDLKESDGYFFSSMYSNTWRYYLGKLIIYRIYAEIQDHLQKIIVKEPSSNLSAADIISKCTPKSKIIILLRDGRDVIDSVMDGRQKKGWMAKNSDKFLREKLRNTFIEKSARWWNNQTEVLLKTASELSEERKLLVHYEDLLKNTFKTMKKIYNFINVPISDEELKEVIDKFSFENISPELKGKGKFYRFATPGLWKENFSVEEKNIMNKIMKNMLVKLGYK